MNRPAELATLSNSLLDGATGPELLTDTLERYRDLLLTASGLELGDDASLEPRNTGRGMAIGATWAALCIDDQLRTHRFVRGLERAVRERLAERPGPVHVLYAGCGPFATLALPTMTRFSPEEVQFSLLEINEVSLVAVKRLLADLGLEAYVRDLVATDASTYVVPKPGAVDILLTETMQFSLMDEMQVPICLNLLPQLPVTTLLIPERIELRLGRMHDDGLEFLAEDLGQLLTIDRASLRAYARTEESTDFPGVRLALPAAGGLFAIRTRIQVYDDIELLDYESGLTNPEIVARFPDAEGTPEFIECVYQVEPSPYLRLAYPELAAR